MAYIKGDAVRHCVNCGRQLTKMQEKYCRWQCYHEVCATQRVLPEHQLNIIEVVRDGGGIRWVPESNVLHAMISERIPLVELLNTRPVGIGRTNDYQLRLTKVGLRWVEKHEKEIS